MTSLMGSNFPDTLHAALASHINVLSQKTSDSEAPTTFSSSSSSDSPPYDPMSLVTSGMTEQNSGIMDMFKDGIFAALAHQRPVDLANSDTASSESPEPVAQPGEHEESGNGTEESQSAALSLIQSFGTPVGKGEENEQQQYISEATIRDLMPVLAQATGRGTSPFSQNSNSLNNISSSNGANSSPSAWARNAGRKKSHPVWDFFKDMKDSTGAGGVICLHCTWSGDDRSPNNLRTHLKKFHSDDGIFNRFSEKLAKQQDCTLVMDPPHSKDDSAFFDNTTISADSTEIDTSQLMALLEQHNAASASAVNDSPHVAALLKKEPLMDRELSPLTAARATEILFAAGMRPHKKTSEIWEHYKCLNEKQNVECIYCWKVLKRNDSSTKSMWGHMNAYHQDVLRDGTTRKKIKRAGGAGGLDFDETPTQPYVKRVRGGGNTASSSGSHHNLPSMVKLEQKPMLDSMAFLQQLQQTGNLTEADFASFANGSSLNFLDSLPKSSEVININSGFVKKEEVEEDSENHVEAASSSSSDEPICKSESPDTYGSPNTSTNDQNEQLAAFVSSLSSSNPMMFAMLNAAGAGNSTTSQFPSAAPKPNTTVSTNGATRSTSPLTHDTSNGSMSPSKLEKDPSSFSLSEGHCAAQLMSMALDLEMTMSYHKRRSEIELCFESNRTVEESGAPRKVICLTDLGKEIKITERINGAVRDTELWVKTDFNQFHWAIRGKCQKCFIKNSA
ncbi:CBN-BED-2 protein [Caenorhabditis brenneri]|uniref:CBN-BED-2 protein n=1 Tax=Caenorhabditis brenneri TaxID=135651 RepID=G0NRJ0_CAEBE|nr:CBN-BED-2 protein [Caenorhabditis brenneri]